MTGARVPFAIGVVLALGGCTALAGIAGFQSVDATPDADAPDAPDAHDASTDVMVDVRPADSGATTDVTDAAPPADTSLPDAPDGACPAGCVLASGQTNPSAIAVDSTRVFWTNDTATSGSVVSMALDGSGLFVNAPAQDHPNALTITASDIYWTSSGNSTIQTASRPNGAPAPVLTVAGGTLSSITTIGLNIAWTDQAASGAVRQCKPNTCATTITDLDNADTLANLLLSSGGMAWWTSSLYGGSILGCPLNNCAVLEFPLVKSLGDVRGLVEDANNLYWTANKDPGAVMTAVKVMSLPEAGVPASALLMVTGQPGGIAVDGAYVYFTNITAGTVSKVLKTGGKEMVLASGITAPQAIAVDGTSIYFTAGDGTVRRLAK